MRFVTIDHWIADQHSLGDGASDAPSAAAAAEYRRYFQSIHDRLPPGYLSMIDRVSLHDGRLRAIAWSNDSRLLEMRIDAFDSTGRYYRAVTLSYLDILSFETTSDPDKCLPGPGGFGDLGHEEIEVLEEGVFKHSILFSSGIELAVTFTRFDCEVFEEKDV